MAPDSVRHPSLHRLDREDGSHRQGSDPDRGGVGTDPAPAALPALQASVPGWDQNRHQQGQPTTLASLELGHSGFNPVEANPGIEPGIAASQMPIGPLPGWRLAPSRSPTSQGQ